MTTTGYQHLLCILLLSCVQLSRCFRNVPIAATSSGFYLSHTTTTGNIRGIAALYVGGETIDCAIESLDINHRKVSLSIKLLEELQNKEAVSKFSSPLSGKNLPFSSLSDKLEDKKTNKKE